MAAATKTPRPKRKMSAAGRRRIADATRKRWAECHQKKAEASKSAGKPAVMKKKAAPKKAAAKTAIQPAVAEVASE
jgi:hypothetical protein